MKPVWAEFPHIPWGSLGWRMGAGEDYWHSWVKWFKALSAEKRATYQTQWPESGRWTGFYAFIERGETPPWALEEKRRTLAAAKPPEPDEERIEERYRFLWMRNHYLKRYASVALPVGAQWAEVWVAPNGDQWLIVIPAGGISPPYMQRHRG